MLLSWLGAALLVCGACGGEAGSPVGLSRPRGDDHPTKGASGATPGAPSPLPADFRDHMARLTTRQLSRGHAERFDAIVWVNDVARAAWDGSGAMPEGAWLVEEAMAHDGATPAEPMGFLVMQKQSGNWRFVAIGPDGDVAEGTRTERCAACHAQAPRDFVFQALSSSTSSAAPRMATVANTVASAAAATDARSAGSASLPSSR